MVRVGSLSSALKSISAFESNTTQSVSARWKTAVGTAALNGNDSFRLAPSRESSAPTAPAGRVRGGVAARGAEASADLPDATAAAGCAGAGCVETGGADGGAGGGAASATG